MKAQDLRKEAEKLRVKANAKATEADTARTKAAGFSDTGSYDYAQAELKNAEKLQRESLTLQQQAAGYEKQVMELEQRVQEIDKQTQEIQAQAQTQINQLEEKKKALI